ncbi:hypothetical protein Bca4012_007283 [Brassica carinata]|uniref:Uncharacterized protein n=1 Tax=Brassica carinata TaxID=52824 RepID=A0A8X7UVK3_BRACI|nr:hypothetical protein Bca52824_038000 [Brassica carinata]
MGSNQEFIEDIKITLLRQMHDEFQKMKVSKSFRSLEATINHMVKIVRKMKACDGGASDGTASRSSQTVLSYPILSIGQSKTSPPEQRRARTVPDGHHHHTLLATIFNRSNSCKHGYGFTYLQLPTRPTRPVSFGTYGKHPFDRGRNGDVEACLVKDEPVLGRPPPLGDNKFDSPMLLWRRNITCS